MTLEELVQKPGDRLDQAGGTAHADQSVRLRLRRRRKLRLGANTLAARNNASSAGAHQMPGKAPRSEPRASSTRPSWSRTTPYAPIRLIFTDLK